MPPPRGRDNHLRVAREDAARSDRAAVVDRVQPRGAPCRHATSLMPGKRLGARDVRGHSRPSGQSSERCWIKWSHALIVIRFRAIFGIRTATPC